MNIKTKKIICFIIVLAFIAVPVANAETSIQPLDYAEKQTISNETYRAVKKDINPDNYGGMYIDDDGDLNVLLVAGGMVKLRNAIIVNQLDNQKIIYRQSLYSLSFLEGVQEVLMSLDERYFISLSEINEFENRIMVGILPLLNQEKLKARLYHLTEVVLNLRTLFQQHIKELQGIAGEQ